MADAKISELTEADAPLEETDTLVVVRGGVTQKMPAAGLLPAATADEVRALIDVVTTVAPSSGTVTLNLALGRKFTVNLTGNVTAWTISNVPADPQGSPITLRLVQDGTGGKTVAWPASFRWAGGTAPTLTTTANAVDIIVADTGDNGTTWDAGVFGLAFAAP